MHAGLSFASHSSAHRMHLCECAWEIFEEIMIMLTAKFFGCLALAGVLCMGAGAADNAADEQPIATSAKRDEKKDVSLASRIQDDFRNDPLFKGSRVKIDLYDGLAVVHGSASADAAIPLINEKLKSNKGVTAVYNYMATPDRAPYPGSFDVTFE